MPPRAAAPPGDAAGQGQQQQGGGAWGSIRQAIITFLIIQVVTNGLKYVMKPKTAPEAVVVNATDAQPSAAAPASPTQQPAQPNVLALWPAGTVFDAHLYVSDAPLGQLDLDNPKVPHTTFSGLKLGDWKWKEEWNTEIQLPKSAQNNGSLWLDIILAREGAPIHPRNPKFKYEDVHHTRKDLVYYEKQKRVRAVKKLISAGTEEPVETEEEAQEKDQAMPIISYYNSNLTVTVVSNVPEIGQAQLNAPQIGRYVRVVAPAPNTLNPRFYPIIFPNTFWQLKGHSYPVNETVDSVPLHIKLEPISFFKFQTFSALDQSFSEAAQKPGMGAGAADFDEIKRIFLETNPILLMTTIAVTILHSLFEFLAFKNDVSHWKNQKDQTGVSLRTIVTNVIVQLIVTLYLFDNSTETSWMILGSQGIGLLIEAWKITKAVNIKVVPNPGKLLPYKLEITDKHVLSEDEKATQEYDRLAFKYVIWGTTPLLIGYTIYSLLYQEHRGWYSFVITTLTSFVYAFGFIQLIPQLIINYKLKSVAHMPLRSLTYKALNTVVDDFFSFVISMPFLHRLACFRDDVVFVILLYQYWIYPVDKSRANEYGQKLDVQEKDKAEPEKEAEKAKAIKAESRKDR